MKKKEKKALAEFIARGLVDRVVRVLKSLEKNRVDPTDVNTHALSTSMRRVFVIDSFVRKMYGVQLLGGERERIKDFRRTVGGIRDVQEIGKKFIALEFDNRFAAAYISSLRFREKQAREEIRVAVEKFDDAIFHELTEEKAIAAKLKFTPNFKPSQFFRRLLRSVLKLRKDAIKNEDDRALHKMRVRYKSFRYTIELLSPDYTGEDEKRLAYLRTLQEAMGQAHDWMVLDEDATAFAESRSLMGSDIVLKKIRENRQEANLAAREYLPGELSALSKRYRL